jgi:hypothetical protein
VFLFFVKKIDYALWKLSIQLIFSPNLVNSYQRQNISSITYHNTRKTGRDGVCYPGFREMIEEARPEAFAQETAKVEAVAIAAVMQAEQQLGFRPRDVSLEKRGHDIKSIVPDTGRLRFIEVKGRVRGAKTITVTKNEILSCLNKPDDFILAIVEVDGEDAVPKYVRCPFHREPDFGVTSVNYEIRKLLEAGQFAE